MLGPVPGSASPMRSDTKAAAIGAAAGEIVIVVLFLRSGVQAAVLRPVLSKGCRGAETCVQRPLPFWQISAESLPEGSVS
jgi:hypothetical protein